jgi:hypothetical protein
LLLKTSSKILNPGPAVKLRSRGGSFAALPRNLRGGDGVAYIIAWTLGPPLSLIIIFWLLFGA